MFRFLADDAATVAHWFSQPASRAWIAQEKRLLGHMLPGLTGYRGITLGAWLPAADDSRQISTLRHWQLGVWSMTAADVHWDGQHLPLASASVDALVLLHGLEMVAEPHALVRDCARVLSDRGQLVVLSVNPWSFWAMQQSLPSRHRQARFRPCSIPPRAARLIDWLRVLDIETTECWRYGPGFPLFGNEWQAGQDSAWLRGLAWQAPGYGLLARRRARCRPQSGRRKSALSKSVKPGLVQPVGREISQWPPTDSAGRQARVARNTRSP